MLIIASALAISNIYGGRQVYRDTSSQELRYVLIQNRKVIEFRYLSFLRKKERIMSCLDDIVFKFLRKTERIMSCLDVFKKKKIGETKYRRYSFKNGLLKGKKD